MTKIGTKASVWKGNSDQTSGGLKKKDIGRVKTGVSAVTGKPTYRYFSKAKSKLASKKSGPLATWRKALDKAKKDLGYGKRDFVLPKKKGGKKAQRDLYKAAKAYHNKMKK